MTLANNDRLWYACQMVGISATGVTATADILEAHGVQSIGITTTFNVEDVTELAKAEAYEIIEGVPDVEVTMEKVIDGYPLLYHMCTIGSTNTTFSSRRKSRCDLRLGLYPDDEDFADGSPDVEVFCSGLHLNSVNYSFPVDGNCTESVTLIGDNKKWLTGGAVLLGTTQTDNIGPDDEPKAYTDGNGGVQRRENVDMQTSILPISIRKVGIAQAGDSGRVGAVTGNNWNTNLSTPRAHIQTITISADFSKEALNELGRKSPYTRTSNGKIQVTSEFSVITTEGDFVSAYENGDPAFVGTNNEGNNTSQESIFIALNDGSSFDLGSKNKLNSVTYGGGDADGGNVAISYSYQNVNSLNITHTNDPR